MQMINSQSVVRGQQDESEHWTGNPDCVEHHNDRHNVHAQYLTDQQRTPSFPVPTIQPQQRRKSEERR